MMVKKLMELNEVSAAGLYEEPDRSLFYRKALGLRRFYETCGLPEYHGELLYPSGKAPLPIYKNGLAFNQDVLKEKSPEAFAQIQADFFQYTSSVPQEHAVGGNMVTHSMPHYERVLKEGFLSYISRINQMDDVEIRDGLIQLLEGIQCYLTRCVTYLESVRADEKLISALRKVPMHPAENIYEAVLAWNFVFYLDSCDNLGCVASGLLPYYKGESILELLCNLFDNADENNAFSMVLGTDYNPLTLQCLEASKGRRRPMLELFVDENTPDEIWEKAFEVIRTSNGQPAFYNPSVLLGGLRNKFKNITDEDIKKFCGAGCTEPMISGMSNVGSLDAGINLLLVLEECMKNDLEKSKDMEEFYQQYISGVQKVVDMVTTEISNSQRERAKHNPVPMRTLLIDDCIDKGIEYNNGGARYKWSIINFAGMINVIDSMLVIRDFIFEQKKYSVKEFLENLENENTEFLNQCRNHSIAYGIDNTVANLYTKRISSDIFSMLDDKKPYFGGGFLPACIQFNSQVGAGKKIGATPDGRTAGAPLCDSLAAIFGKDTKGPTALLKSVASLDLKRAIGVPVLSFNIRPDFDNHILKALILGYMSLGGIHIQITCISREMLEEAYRNPELHKNLVVRVGGYSEHFYRLNDELKKMIIDRTIQTEL